DAHNYRDPNGVKGIDWEQGADGPFSDPTHSFIVGHSKGWLQVLIDHSFNSGLTCMTQTWENPDPTPVILGGTALAAQSVFLDALDMTALTPLLYDSTAAGTAPLGVAG